KRKDRINKLRICVSLNLTTAILAIGMIARV
ncbi:MAG: hypothetical protein ACI8W9_002185, partial [Psychromonas sp.]